MTGVVGHGGTAAIAYSGSQSRLSRLGRIKQFAGDAAKNGEFILRKSVRLGSVTPRGSFMPVLTKFTTRQGGMESAETVHQSC
jgi:hypothetical protein